PSPLGSSTTPSRVTFWLTTIFPILMLLASGARPGLGPPLTGQMPPPGWIGRRNAAQFANPAASLPLSEPNAPGGSEGKRGCVVTEMDTADLIARARTGDHDAFRDLVQGHSHELQVHCYRILGSLPDAEDAVQETLVSAWRNLGEFGQRSSLRTWLYKIATNRCLDMLRAASRRPRIASPLPEATLPEPAGAGDAPPGWSPAPTSCSATSSTS